MRRLLLAIFTCALVVQDARGAELRLAVAANFNAPMRELAAAFEQDTGHVLKIAPGASGKLYAQIRQGAPYDLFFSADQNKPAALVRDGLALGDSRYTYASGRLVLWTRRPDYHADEIRRALSQSEGRIAVANARIAPYGAAAEQVLGALGLADQLRPRLVYGESVSQAYQFAASGNARFGLVAASVVMRDGAFVTGSGILVPQTLHGPVLQDAVVLTRSQFPQAAMAFLAYLHTNPAQQIISRYGYMMPTPPVMSRDTVL
ncbi:MAG: molybdate ABC transporter substrate-binding protein [Pseudomonadota bacterium]